MLGLRYKVASTLVSTAERGATLTMGVLLAMGNPLGVMADPGLRMVLIFFFFGALLDPQ